MIPKENELGAVKAPQSLVKIVASRITIDLWLDSIAVLLFVNRETAMLSTLDRHLKTWLKAVNKKHELEEVVIWKHKNFMARLKDLHMFPLCWCLSSQINFKFGQFCAQITFTMSKNSKFYQYLHLKTLHVTGEFVYSCQQTRMCVRDLFTVLTLEKAFPWEHDLLKTFC